MDKKDEQEKQDKRKIEEYKKNPMINLADSINHAKMGDLGELTKRGVINTIITIAIIIGILVFFINALIKLIHNYTIYV